MELFWSLPSRASGSIGIIGGADGPTAVFVTSRYPVWVFVLAGLLAVGGVVLLIANFIKQK